MNGLAVWIALCIMFSWLGSKWRKRIVGMGLLTDISVHILLQVLLGGANDGRMAMLFGGVMFNLTLMLYRKLRGYSTLSQGEWVEHSGWFRRVKSRSTESSRSAV
jgi:hypothetical protein